MTRTEALSLTIAAKDTRIKALREALEEIRDVARISDGVEWYAMIASEALTKDDARFVEDVKDQ